MNKINYQKVLDQLTDQLKGKNEVPKLLLHSCCAPCSSYCLEYLSEYFEITVLYYNPNIYPKEEYDKRVEEQARLIREMPFKHPVRLIEGKFEPEKFFEMAKGLENVKEGGERCFKCYKMRLEKTAEYAAKKGFDYFTTTLSISPYKNAQKLNEIGEIISLEKNIKYLHSDFKKKNGYRRSIELSDIYGLYRQDYCGCIFSKIESDKRRGEHNEN